MTEFYMICSVDGHTHLVIGYGKSVQDGRRRIAEDFGVPIEAVEYECTLDEFANALD